MITKLFDKAYLHKTNRKHDFLYVAVDMHGTVFKHFSDNITYIPINAINGLNILCDQPEIILLGFTSSYPNDINRMEDTLSDLGIHFKYFNKNPECENTETGDFSTKFYYDILLDDRAGFDPTIHWQEIIDYYTKEK